MHWENKMIMTLFRLIIFQYRYIKAFVNIYVQRLVVLGLESEARARHLQQGNWKTTQEKGKRNASKRFGHSLPTLESPPTEASSCYRFEYFCKSVLYGAATERRKS